jgi:surface antigen
MSSVEDRPGSSFFGKKSISKSLRMPRFASQLSPAAEQLAFPHSPQHTTGSLSPIAEYDTPSTSPQITRPLSYLPALINTTPEFLPGVEDSITRDVRAVRANVTRNLTEVQTGSLQSISTQSVQTVKLTNTSTLRPPILIRSTGKKSRGTMRPPEGRRWVIHTSVTLALVLIAVGALFVVVPAGRSGEDGFNPFQSFVSWIQGSSNNPNALAAQISATATAVTVGGKDTGSRTYAGLPTPPPGSPGYDGFTYGQCTYWADYLYHQMSGNWVPWAGDAWAWANGARAYGWHVSGTPIVPSIIVLQPYTEGAGPYGHVAVVIGINGDGSVHTSNWNFYANGGGWARTSYYDFRPGSGVSFVWK